jgi:hypothetical protein
MTTKTSIPAGIKPCDVIMHKVYYSSNGQTETHFQTKPKPNSSGLFRPMAMSQVHNWKMIGQNNLLVIGFGLV